MTSNSDTGLTSFSSTAQDLNTDTICIEVIMRSIQTDLENVEDHLERQMTFGQLVGGAGYSVCESIRSILGTIRTRLSIVQAEEENSTSDSPAPSEFSSQQSIGRQSPLASFQHLSQRLHAAELSHSNQVPLELVQNAIRSRSEVNVSTTTHTLILPGERPIDRHDRGSGHGVHQPLQQGSQGTQGPHEQPPQEQQELQQPQTSASFLPRVSLIQPIPATIAVERRTSLLVVSRANLPDDELCGLQDDVELHGNASFVAFLRSDHMDVDDGIEIELTADSPVDSIPNVSLDSMDVTYEDERESSNTLSIDPQYTKPISSDTKRTPILLPRISMTNLPPLSQSVLFPQEDDTLVLDSSLGNILAEPSTDTNISDNAKITTTTETTTSVVYSWGTGVTSLHDDSNDTTVENAKVNISSRVGRSGIVSCSVGPNHSACCDMAGRVLSKGRNNTGAVDPDKKDESLIVKPVILESLGVARIVQVSCGIDHTAALRSNGVVLTWGSNEYGQLGHRDQNTSCRKNRNFCRPAVMSIGLGQTVTKVECGDGFTLCLTSRMTLLACGDELMAGYRKDEDTLPAPIPALVGLPLVNVAAGRRHAVVTTVHGTVFAWGENSQGCCGREYPKASSVPVSIKLPSSNLVPQGRCLPTPLSDWAYWNRESHANHLCIADDVSVVNAALGSDHSILVTKSGRLFVCGSNQYGQLGLPTNSVPNLYSFQALDHPRVNESFRFVMAAAGEKHSLVLDNRGFVWHFGTTNSQDSNIISTTNTMTVLPMKQIKWIAAGGNQSVAVASNIDCNQMELEYSQTLNSREINFESSVEDLLNDIIEKTHTNSNQSLECAVADLADRTHELIRNPAVLNGLFLDPSELDELYKKLLSLDVPGFRKAIFHSLENGMWTGLNSLELDGSRLRHVEQLRFLLLYLQCPLFVDWKMDDVVFDRRGDLVLKLCEVILELPYEGYRSLMTWATSSYSPNDIVQFLIRPLLSQLGKGLSVGAGAETRAVPSIATVLKWLHVATERASVSIRAEDFHCEAISTMSMERLLQEMNRYHKTSKEQRSKSFFLCNYPFLIAPNAKRKLLQLENEMNMLNTAATELTFNPALQALEFNPFYTIDIDREQLLVQTLDKISRARSKDLRRKLRVVFKGEDGVDAGGVTREFFQLISAQLFDTSTGMWSTRYQDGHVTWFNSDCSWNDKGFYLCGVLVGLAVYNTVLLDVHFPTAVYRKLLGLPLGFEDIVDKEIKSSLQALLDYNGDDVEDVFSLMFDVPYMDLGQEKRRELKPNGSNVPVTSENKEEFVLLYTKWLLQDSIYPQYAAFEEGFMKVMEDSSFHILKPEELELLVVGTPELDFSALRKKVEYEGFTDDSEVIQNLWRFLTNASQNDKIQFLKFTTGSPKAPIGGLGSLPFKIQRAGPDSDNLPTAHTCFNTLLLPDYGGDYAKLENRLGRAILECEGFGLQ